MHKVGRFRVQSSLVIFVTFICKLRRANYLPTKFLFFLRIVILTEFSCHTDSYLGMTLKPCALNWAPEIWSFWILDFKKMFKISLCSLNQELWRIFLMERYSVRGSCWYILKFDFSTVSLFQVFYFAWNFWLSISARFSPVSFFITLESTSKLAVSAPDYLLHGHMSLFLP